MLSTTADPRAVINDNFWLRQGEPEDLESPPHGRLLGIRYANGDALRVEFFDIDSVEAANERWPEADAASWGISFPITASEIHFRVGGTDIDFGPRYTKLP